MGRGSGALKGLRGHLTAVECIILLCIYPVRRTTGRERREKKKKKGCSYDVRGAPLFFLRFPQSRSSRPLILNPKTDLETNRNCCIPDEESHGPRAQRESSKKKKNDPISDDFRLTRLEPPNPSPY